MKKKKLGQIEGKRFALEEEMDRLAVETVWSMLREIEQTKEILPTMVACPLSSRWVWRFVPVMQSTQGLTPSPGVIGGY